MRKKRWEKLQKKFKDDTVFFISSHSSEGIENIISKISDWVSNENKNQASSAEYDVRFKKS
jgi:hypothetical protein